jgi:hypothetical protein
VNRSQALKLLPDAIQEAAIRVSDQPIENAEVMWPLFVAANAIDELVDVGFVILGLDVRNPARDPQWTEIALSSYDGSDLETSRIEAHRKLSRAEELTETASPLILITWSKERSDARR